MAEVRDCSACGEPIRYVDTSCWSCGAPAKRARPAKVRRPRPQLRVESARLPAVLGMVGGGLLIIGSFLPWAVLSERSISYSQSGTDMSDGWVTVILGAVAAYASYQDRRKVSPGLRAGLFVLGGLSTLIVGYQLRDLGPFDPGFGLLVAGVGCVTVLLGGWFAHRQAR